MYPNGTGTHDRAKEGYFAFNRVDVRLSGFIWGCHGCRSQVLSSSENARVPKTEHSNRRPSELRQDVDRAQILAKPEGFSQQTTLMRKLRDGKCNTKRILLIIHNVSKRVERRKGRFSDHRLMGHATQVPYPAASLRA